MTPWHGASGTARSSYSIRRQAARTCSNELAGEVLRRLVAAERGTTIGALAAELADDPSGADDPDWTRGHRRGAIRFCAASVSRDRKRLDRRRSVRPRARTPAGRPRPPAADGTRRHPDPIAAARGRPGNFPATTRIIRPTTAKALPISACGSEGRATSAGGCSPRRTFSSTGTRRLRRCRSTRDSRCSSGGSTGASRRTAIST